jgi:hypothetical protein
MSFTHRHDVVSQFHTDPKIILMIAGLKCGGQALNLTCANRVISIGMLQIISPAMHLANFVLRSMVEPLCMIQTF